MLTRLSRMGNGCKCKQWTRLTRWTGKSNGDMMTKLVMFKRCSSLLNVDLCPLLSMLTVMTKLAMLSKRKTDLVDRLNS